MQPFLEERKVQCGHFLWKTLGKVRLQEERPRALHKKYSVSIFYYAPEPNEALSRRTYCSLRERTYRLALSRVMHRCSLLLCSVDETFTLIVVLVVPKSVGIHWFASKPDYAWHSRQRSALGVINTVSFNSQSQLIGHLLCSSPPSYSGCHPILLYIQGSHTLSKWRCQPHW